MQPDGLDATGFFVATGTFWDLAFSVTALPLLTLKAMKTLGIIQTGLPSRLSRLEAAKELAGGGGRVDGSCDAFERRGTGRACADHEGHVVVRLAIQQTLQF